MSKRLAGLALTFVALCGASARCAEPVRDYPIRSVPMRHVRFADAFWLPRLEVNRTITIPVSFQTCEESGRIENFKVAGGLSDRKWAGMFGFSDSDTYKVMEGAAYTLMTHPDEKLSAYLDKVVDYVRAAQEEDGYLNTVWTAREQIDPKQLRCCYPKDGKKWLSEFDSHELYNVGHMYEAAVAHWEATGSQKFLGVARKSADLLVDTFGPGKIELPPGHPETELGLVKLYRATKDERYLQLAKFYLDVRGRPTEARPKLWGENRQDHKPLVEQDEAVGHAVRAMYLYAAGTDVAVLTGDQALLDAMDRLWKNVAEKKTYLTGGIGATREGEAFGKEYDLPNDTAYAETCANVATCLWNHRMFLSRGEGKYIDALERSLYNGSIAGVALDGKAFFYPNPLASAGGYSRSKWFDCSCCPTTVCRFIPTVPEYAYATRDNVLYVNLFVTGSADVVLANGTVQIEQETAYPWDGGVEIKLTPQEATQRIALRLRIPGWARGQAFVSDLYRFASPSDERFSVTANGEAVNADVADGYVTIDREWQSGDRIKLNLPMPVGRVVAKDQVAADRGRVALMRGPIVYCVEWPDVADGKVLNLVLPDKTVLKSEFRKDLLGGVQVITGMAWQPNKNNTEATTAENQERVFESRKRVPFVAIPYYAWANRGPGEMAVWMARSGVK